MSKLQLIVLALQLAWLAFFAGAGWLVMGIDGALTGAFGCACGFLLHELVDWVQANRHPSD